MAGETRKIELELQVEHVRAIRALCANIGCTSDKLAVYAFSEERIMRDLCQDQFGIGPVTFSGLSFEQQQQLLKEALAKWEEKQAQQKRQQMN